MQVNNTKGTTKLLCLLCKDEFQCHSSETLNSVLFPNRTLKSSLLVQSEVQSMFPTLGITSTLISLPALTSCVLSVLAPNQTSTLWRQHKALWLGNPRLPREDLKFCALGESLTLTVVLVLVSVYGRRGNQEQSWAQYLACHGKACWSDVEMGSVRRM